MLNTENHAFIESILLCTIRINKNVTYTIKSLGSTKFRAITGDK